MGYDSPRKARVWEPPTGLRKEMLKWSGRVGLGMI